MRSGNEHEIHVPGRIAVQTGILFVNVRSTRDRSRGETLGIVPIGGITPRALDRSQVLRGARVALLGAFVVVALALAADSRPSGQAPTRRAGAVSAAPSDLMTHSALVPCRAAEALPVDAPGAVRIATWNIHAARSAFLEAIAAELRTMKADIVGLQEVDVGMRRSGFVHQPEALARALGLHYAFAASINYHGGDYGLALLSRWPLADVRRHRLDSPGAREPRIVLDVTVCANGRALRVFNHHADTRDAARQVGLAELVRLVQPAVGRGVVVLGDFNERPEAPGVRGLVDAGLVDLVAEHDSNTASGWRIDYVLVDAPLASLTSAAQVWPTDHSDHPALLADLAW
ncbi:MAG: endonuclease/exonuclease/phosphatase family protein [Acidobacteria bacterium]|nr:endonuclease/exonuclease/phosphatase family protein [Acidobacteriota bacterium]